MLGLASLLLLLIVKTGSPSNSERDGLQSASCPNGCSGQGACLNKAKGGYLGVCTCFPGFHGPDCSLRLCPGGKAWVDFPVSKDLAHNNYTECSNMGTCNRGTGKCNCRKGFGGPACDTMLCPLGPSHSFDSQETLSPCSGNGRCISLRQAAVAQDYQNFFNYTVYSDWDADMIHGCACQKGWEGTACQRRSCPKGIDPLVPAVNEVQLIECKCTTCTGGMYLSFRNKVTAYIPYDASRQLVRQRLEQLSTIEKVSVRFSSQSKLCSSSGSVLLVEFKQPRGDLETMTLRTQGGLAGTINVISGGAYSSIDVTQASNDGTYTYAACSNRGDCDYSIGSCVCYPGFRSSNGAGGSGGRGDCGYQEVPSLNISFGLRPLTYNESFPDAWQSVPVSKIAYSQGCPFTNFGGICNGKGVCSSTTSTCMCNMGWEGPRCDRKSCGKARTWFGDVGLLHSHWSVCGGIGECNYNTGKCENCGGGFGSFGGPRCEQLLCPANATGALCSGSGQCLSMKNLAGVAYTSQKELAGITYSNAWDKNAIYGCACYRSPTVDNIFTDYTSPLQANTPRNADPRLMFYRGPYANAATDFAGYVCSSNRCPRGDNPETRNDVNEVQTLVCTATSGTFALTFRENTTALISFDTTLSEFEYDLQLLRTIRKVSVTSGTSGLPDGWDDFQRRRRLTAGDPTGQPTGQPSVQPSRQPLAYDNRICTSSGNVTLYIEFETEFGDLPLLTLETNNLASTDADGTTTTGSITISEYQKGTKEDIECSGQGVCDEAVGVCSCFDGYASSNSSLGHPGDRGDCTWKNIYSGY